MSGRGTTKVGPRFFLCAFLILFSLFLVFAECHLSVLRLVRVDKVVVERFAPPGSPDSQTGQTQMLVRNVFEVDMAACWPLILG